MVERRRPDADTDLVGTGHGVRKVDERKLFEPAVPVESETPHATLPFRSGPPAGPQGVVLEFDARRPELVTDPVRFRVIPAGARPGPRGQDDRYDGGPGSRRAGGRSAEEAEHLLAPTKRRGEFLERAARVPLETRQLLREASRPAEEQGDRFPGVEIVGERGVEPFDQLLGFFAEGVGDLRAGTFRTVPFQDLRDPLRHYREAGIGFPRLFETLPGLVDERAAVLRIEVVEAKRSGALALDRLDERGDVPERLRHLLLLHEEESAVHPEIRERCRAGRRFGERSEERR